MTPTPATTSSDGTQQHTEAPLPPTSDSDIGTASEDGSSDTDELAEEDAQSVIGVSIGHGQSHFKNPKTPAAEKAAMLENIEGGGHVDKATGKESTAFRTEERTEVSLVPQKNHVALESSVDEQRPRLERLPSPWRAGPKTFPRNEETRASLRDGFGHHRRRASWGTTAQETLRRIVSFNLPSLPKSPSFLGSFSPLSYTSAFDRRREELPGNNDTPRRKKANTLSLVTDWQLNGVGLHRTTQRTSSPQQPARQPITRHISTGPVSSRSSGSYPGSPTRLRDPSHAAKRPLQLRRSASDDSLLLYRKLSRASSLGDDSRFANVQEQVNSRFKAIKDSFQDANFKLPSMPTISQLGFSSFRPESQPPRSGPNVSRGLQSFDGVGASSTRFPSSAKAPRSAGERSYTGHRPSRNDSATVSGMNASTHPHFTRALKNLTGDVVVLGGYRGSILRSAEPPHRQLWVPIKVGLNLRKVDLEVGLNPEDEENMTRHIIPGGMLTHIGPVDISRRLLKRLRATENARRGLLRVHEYGYDWRLSPHLLSKGLQAFLEKLRCNQPGTPSERRGAVVLAHSLGGMITRHVVNQKPELFAGVLYAAVPQKCVNILGPLRNGDDVLISSRVLTAQVNFTIRTSFALLPLDGKCFIDKDTKEEYPIDFFDARTWLEHRLSPCIAPHLPALNDPPPGGISGLFGSVTSALPSFPILGGKPLVSKASGSKPPSSVTNSSDSTPRNSNSAKPTSQTRTPEASVEMRGMTPQMHGPNKNNSRLPSPPQLPISTTAPTDTDQPHTTANPATTCTIPRDTALAYLTRTLAEVKAFKEALAFHAPHAAANRYPPVSVIYGKSVPTVYGARVAGRDGIRRADAYDELAFASGDGVVLARAAMLPDGYQAVRGGVVSSERGHVSLLGDLEAVGRCLNAVTAARSKGVGLGVAREGDAE